MTVLGLVLSSLTLIALSVAGLGAVVATSGTLFTIIKYAGAAYLIYLGISIWRSPAAKLEPSAATEGTAVRGRAPLRRLFRTGYLVGISNPKDLLFFGALFPQFIEPADPLYGQLAILSATWLVVAFVVMSAYAAIGSQIAGKLERVGARGVFNKLTGGAFIAAGAALAWVKR
jgi:homoserine/homoserine lactone efflux protein